ncbi:hypothetical protein Scep_009801 [Stephania cephalantha]|uniref:Uncharacterized protein n=1 Tax=Stephania cephalantha TaxID=152367 RepID=A0AAP0JUW0_9MAGN
MFDSRFNNNHVHSLQPIREQYGGNMVAFASRKYATRSLPAFVANKTYTITSFTLVQCLSLKSTFAKSYWKRDGCASCSETPASSVSTDKTAPSEHRPGGLSELREDLRGVEQEFEVAESWYRLGIAFIEGTLSISAAVRVWTAGRGVRRWQRLRDRSTFIKVYCDRGMPLAQR